MLAESDIERITAAVARSEVHLAVGVFGSYAIGTPRARSDLDLFVITETARPPEARRKAVQRALFGILHPVDIHVFTPEEFEEEAYERLSFPWVIARQAKLYFWSDRATTRIPSLATAARRGHARTA